MKGRARIQVSGSIPELAELDFTDGLGGTGPIGGRLKEVPPAPPPPPVASRRLSLSPARETLCSEAAANTARRQDFLIKTALERNGMEKLKARTGNGSCPHFSGQYD